MHGKYDKEQTLRRKCPYEAKVLKETRKLCVTHDWVVMHLERSTAFYTSKVSLGSGVKKHLKHRADLMLFYCSN